MANAETSDSSLERQSPIPERRRRFSFLWVAFILIGSSLCLCLAGVVAVALWTVRTGPFVLPTQGPVGAILAPTVTPRFTAAPELLTPTPSGSSTSDVPLIIQDPTPEELEALGQELYTLKSGHLVEIVLHEGAAQSLVEHYLTQYPDLPVTNLSVRFHQDELGLIGDVNMSGLALKAEARLQIWALNCGPQARIVRVTVGGFFSPKALRDQLAQVLEKALIYNPEDLSICVEEITIQPGIMTIRGTTR